MLVRFGTHPQPSFDFGATTMFIRTSRTFSPSGGEERSEELSEIICQLKASILLLEFFKKYFANLRNFRNLLTL